MTFQPQHTGLYFNSQQITAAQEQRQHPALARAWEHLERGATADLLDAVLMDGLRWRLLGDDAAAERGAAQLLDIWNHDDIRQPDVLMALGQAFELLSDRPELQSDGQQWLTAYADRVRSIQPPETLSLDGFWLSALQTGAGVVLEDEALFKAGVTTFQTQIDHAIHPEGYIRFAVESKSPDSFQQQLDAVRALTLTAEAASQAGRDLWAYENRGVGVSTAAAYVLFYYYYPEKWRWGTPPSVETVELLFTHSGAFMEIVNARRGLRTIEVMLEDRRPLWDPLGGGLTTLTHGLMTPPKKKKRGLFG